MAAREIVVNMVPGGVTPVIHVSQYDDGYGITANLIENSGTYTVPVGATVSIEGTKPDGHGYSYLCTYQDNAVVIPINTQMTAVKGEYACELVVRKEGLRVGSKNVIMAVENAGLAEDTIISDTELPAIIALAQEQEEAAATSATEAAASATSAETSKNAAIDAAQDAIEAAQELQTAVQWNATVIKEEASGAIANIPDGSDNIPMQSVVASFSPIQSGTGDPSPTNVRPISGRTGLTVTRSGKNLMPKSTVNTTSRGITATANADGSVHVTGTATEDTVISMLLNFNLPAGSFIWSSGLNESFSTYDTYLSSGGTIARGNANSPGPSFTLTEARKVTANVRVRSGQTVNITVYPMVRPASIADDTYEPYTGTTIPITWESIAGTVYGGTLDVVSGVLTVEYGKYTIPSDIAVADRIDSQNRVYWNITDMMPGAYLTDENTVCNRLPKSAPTNEPTAPCICIGAASNASYVYLQGVKLLDGVTNLETLRTWLEANPVEFTYKLATPQTYQLTPQEIRTLLGVNNLWSDGDSMDVTYVADTKMYIDNKIAALQALVLEH